MLLVSFPDWDTELFLWLHQGRMEAIATPMSIISSYTFWVFSFLIIVSILIKKDGKWGAIASLFALLGIGTNSLVNNVLKEIIARPRPAFNEEISHLVDTLGHFQTNYSFFSAHSSNSFCLAVFTFLYFKNKYLRITAILWAFLVAYSRIFVGQHYPIDVIVGSLFGILTGTLTYKAFIWYKNKKEISQHE